MKRNMQTALAKKYAKAFLNVFMDALSWDDIQVINKAQQFLVKNKRITYMLKMPVIDKMIKRQGLAIVCARFALPASIEQLIDLLLEHKRSFLFGTVLRSIVKLYKQRARIMVCIMSSSHELSADEQKSAQQFLARQTGYDIIYEYTIDKALIAGMRLQSDTIRWEHSIAKQLHDMRLSLIR